MKNNKTIAQVISLTLAFTTTTMSLSSVAFAQTSDEVYLNNQILIEEKVVNEENLLEVEEMESRPIMMRSAAAGTIAVKGVIDAIPVIVAAGGYIIHKAAEHTKNKRKSTYDKHTKPRPGRSSEKKKQKSNWKPRK
jgi:hypothetical protein